VKVIDHNYVNSFNFEKKEISLIGFMEAIDGYDKNLKKETKACTAISLDKHFKGERKNVLHKIVPSSTVKNKNQKILIENLLRLQDYLYQGENAIAPNYEKVVQFLQKCKQSRSIIFEGFEFIAGMDNNGNIEKVQRLISEYTFIIAVLWKNNQTKNYDILNDKLGNIIQKLNSIIEKERILYSEILSKGESV